MKRKPLVLIGGGGHCKSVIDVAESAGYTILGILDRPEEVGKTVLSYPVLGTDDDMPKYVGKAEFVVTVGQIKSAALRMKLHRMIEDVGGQLATIVSPTAHVSKYASLGEGTVVMHRSIVNADAKVGKGCIINTSSIIEHDVTIGDYSHISTGAVVNGGAVVGEATFIGSCCVINQLVTIGNVTIVGAGAAVVSNIPDKCVAVGVPARIINKMNNE